jgi:UDPglucose 6-dehydrogenase/UDP-N-acetyl-D-galactosamine dehydrogenase
MGAIVVLESTVYPGVTEEVMVPVLESESGFRCGIDFKVGYSPERINPGDDEHTLHKITKVVAGMDRETTGILVQLYGKVALHVYEASNIRTAEAAKVIENIQRDLNIALMNELALIFEKMDIETAEVLKAASTKWNFHKYTPGLIGGHCIPVDPYYLVYKAKEYDYHAQLITAGRAINDYMPRHVAQLAIRALNKAGKVIKDSKVLIMGLTYKENVPDLRETPVVEMIHELKEFDIRVFGYDPVMETMEDKIEVELVTDLRKLPKIDCIIVTVAHDAIKKLSMDTLKSMMTSNPILIDVRGLYDSAKAQEKGIRYFTL